MRYERKYRIESRSYDQVLHEVMSNPACFSESYPDRYINSIYYDDVHFGATNENLMGISQRVKYRLRWYGEVMMSVQNPILETKIKSNILGTKQYEPLSSFDLQSQFSKCQKIQTIQYQGLKPKVLVRYKRTYLESFDHKIRATIDRELMYFPIGHHAVWDSPDIDPAIILEIKYDQNDELDSQYCLQAIPYRMTKNSKFVGAMESHWM